MKTTWILVANRGGASLFERTGKDLKWVQDIPHPQGRLKNSDIGTDKPTRTYDRFGAGRHTTGSEQEPTEHLAEQFAHRLADLLNKGRVDHAYAELILIADPGFLGKLREALDVNTATMLTKTLDKNLPGISATDLAAYLDEA